MNKKVMKWGVVALLVAGFTSANAVNVIVRNTGGEGIWSETNIWSSAKVPVSGDSVYIRNNGIVTLNSTAATNMGNLYIGENTAGTLKITAGGYLNVTGNVAIGRTGAYTNIGTLSIEGGTFVKNGSIIVGNGTVTGIVSISSGSLMGSIEMGSASATYDGGDTLRVIGSTANISGTNFQAGNGSIVEFIFDASGISMLNYSGITRFATGSQIIVDGAAYTGGAQTFTLIGGGDIGTSLGSPTIILTNFAAGTTYDFDTAGNVFTVTTIPEPATIGMLGLGAGAILLVRRRMRR